MIDHEEEKNPKLVDALKEVRKAYKEMSDAYDKEANDFWEQLPYDDKLKAFYAVVQRIHKAEVKDRGSYRYAIYDVFNFNFDSYSIAFDAGYMDIHNYIFDGIEAEKKKDEG